MKSERISAKACLTSYEECRSSRQKLMMPFGRRLWMGEEVGGIVSIFSKSEVPFFYVESFAQTLKSERSSLFADITAGFIRPADHRRHRDSPEPDLRDAVFRAPTLPRLPQPRA